MEEPISEGKVRETGRTGTGITGTDTSHTGQPPRTPEGFGPRDWSQGPPGSGGRQDDGSAAQRLRSRCNRLGFGPSGGGFVLRPSGLRTDRIAAE